MNTPPNVSDAPVGSSEAHHGVWTIVVAGGTGQRFGGQKQFQNLGGKKVVEWAVERARGVSDGVVLVVPRGFLVTDAPHEVTEVVEGGATRTASVRNGLARVPISAHIVCVHDAARPFASRDLFTRVVDAVRAGADAAIPGVDVVDTIKIVETDEMGREVVLSTPRRDTLRAVQTPQAFSAKALREAHARALATGHESTDDAGLIENAGGYVVVVAGDVNNRKITTPDDYEWAQRLVAGDERASTK
jgi:2-C-methyl-D-erythritol 4-phosphate cytidylyltransferase